MAHDTIVGWSLPHWSKAGTYWLAGSDAVCTADFMLICSTYLLF
jgi:hypothetical protein